MSEISVDFTELVRDYGDKVEMHQESCILWKLEHKNCRGCPSELGCCKTAAMLGVSLTPLIYQPQNYEDYEKMHQGIQKKLDKILASKSVVEVQSVSW